MKRHSLLSFLLVGVLVSQCYYDKFDELHPLDGFIDTCDASLANTYTASIKPILLANCVSCHNAKQLDGGIILETYAQAKTIGANGKLAGVVLHQSGYQSMPPGTQIRSCEISKIQAWITAGMPE